MNESITTLTGEAFVNHVSQQTHAMAGAVIALSAAQAVGLGLACVRISAGLADKSAVSAEESVRKLEQLKVGLLQLCNEDAGAIAKFVALRDSGNALSGQRLLCQSPLDIGQHTVNAAFILERFRPQVNERVQDDLEMSITLLAGSAHAAMLLLDSNLRIWPEQPLLSEFEPKRAALQAAIERLSPAKRVRHMD